MRERRRLGAPSGRAAGPRQLPAFSAVRGRIATRYVFAKTFVGRDREAYQEALTLRDQLEGPYGRLWRWGLLGGMASWKPLAALVRARVRLQVPVGSPDHVVEARVMPPLQLAPLRRNFLDRMTVAHWLLLAYPVFLAIVARRRDADDVFTIDSSAVMQIGFVVVMGLFCGVRLITHGRALLRIVFSGPAGWMAVYAILAVASAAWSSRPDFTLYRAVEMTVFLLVTVEAVYRFADVKDVVRFQLLYALVVAVVWHFADLRYEMSWEILHNSLVPGANIGGAGALRRGGHLRPLLVDGLPAGGRVIPGRHVVCQLHEPAVRRGLPDDVPRRGAARRRRAAGRDGRRGDWGYGLDWGALVFWGKNEYAITSASGRIPVWQWLIESVVSQRPLLGTASASERTSRGWPWTGPGSG